MKDIRMNRAMRRHLMMVGVLLSLFFRLSGADARIQLETPSLLTVPPHIRTDSKRKFEFGIDTPAGALQITIRPKHFSIRKGKNYWIDCSVQKPYVVTAERDDMLNLRLEHLPYQYVVVSETGDNLLSGVSFREWDVAKGKQGNRADSLPDGSLVVKKNVSRSMFRMESPEMSLEAGKTYYLTMECRMEKFDYNSYFFPGVQISSGEKSMVRRDASFYFPHIPGKWVFSYLRFTVPPDWKHVKARVFLASDSMPVSFAVRNPDLRQCPELATNWPRHIGTTSQYGPAVSEKNIVPRLMNHPEYTASVVRTDSGPMLSINGRLEIPTGYSGENGSVLRMFYEAGYRLHWVSLDMYAGYYYRKFSKLPMWLADGKFDFRQIDRELSRRLCYAPECPLILSVCLHPYENFAEVHPESAWRDTDGNLVRIEAVKDRRRYHVSLTSDAYRREAGRALRALGEYLKQSPYGRNVIGIHLREGGDTQWYPWNHRNWKKLNFDYSEGNLAQVREQIRRLYGNDVTRLREAWQDTGVTFENLVIPHEREWETYAGSLLDTSNGHARRLSDISRAVSNAVVDTVNHLCGEFKKGIGKPVVTMIYYTNLNATEALMRAPDLDGIVTVPFYGQYREPGKANFVEQPVGSFRLNNKILLTEIDHRSDFSQLLPRIGGYDRRGLGVPDGADAFENQLRRDLAFPLTQGGYSWFLTIAGYNTWAGDYQRILPEYNRAVRMIAAQPVRNDWGQIAFFQDKHSRESSGRSYGFIFNTFRLPRIALLRSGVSFSDYLIEDIGNPALPKYKIYLFADAVNLREEQIKWIERTLQKDGNILVFTFATALNASGGFEKNIRRLTGMNIRKDLRRKVRMQYAEKHSQDPLAAGLDTIRIEQGEMMPLFYVDDPTAVPLAWYDKNPDLTAAAVKRHKNWTAVYSGPGTFSPEFPRALAAEAGIRPVGPLNDVTVAGNGIVAVHAAVPGSKTINLAEKVNLMDLSTGQWVAFGTDRYTFFMKFGETKWFKIAK